ncbi:MAG TPA: tetratricopeptide repeat protein [Pyrinomonadaceae bacterium]
MRRVFDDPGIERFGRTGQKQFGIDGLSPVDSTITFQCKLKDTRHKTDDRIREVLLQEMEEELSRTDGLAKPLTRFVFASTFKNDTELQRKAATLSSSTLTAEYWGWDTISERIWEYAEQLIPIYYPEIPVRPVQGFKQISDHFIEESRITDQNQLKELALEYYRINDRTNIVLQVVINDIDVRNTRVMDEVYRRLERMSPSATLWLIGDGGSGKTTILHRVAVERALRGDNVFTLDLETHIGPTDVESIFNIIKYCSPSEQTLLCIDNPAADEVTLERILREVPDYAGNVHIVLAERGHRYRALKKSGVLTYLHGEEEAEPIRVRNPQTQREHVYQRLFDLLGIDDADRQSLLATVRDERLVYVNATYQILLELKKKRKIIFDFDWDDYRKACADLPAFREGYKYIALFYLFGVRTPCDTFSRICGAGEGEQRLFLERFRGLVNEPIVVDEWRDESFHKITHLRTKHEIVSEIFFSEHPENKDEMFMEWCEQVDFANPIEVQALINIFGAKKNYVGENRHINFGRILDFLLNGYLEQRVALSPKLHATLHLARSWLLLVDNKIEGAIDVLHTLLKKQPQNLHCRTELARIYQQQTQLNEAESLLLGILDFEPTDVNSRTELAKIYQKQGRLNLAEAVLRQILQIRGSDLNARTELSKIYQRQGKLAEAESVLLELLQFDSKNIRGRTELAKVYQRLNRLTEAEKVLRPIFEIAPDDLNSRTELAKIYHRQGKLAEAETLLLQSLQIDDNQLHPRTELAKIYQRQGKLAEAEALLLQSLQIDNQQLHPRTELAKIYQRQGKLAEAETLLLQSLQIDDKQLHPRTELAKIYQRQGKLAEAETILGGLLQLDPNNLQARTELAKIYQHQGKLVRAEALLLQSLQIDDKQLHPRTELAKIYHRQGKLAEAETVLLELLQLEPDDLQARTELAKIYQRQGKLPEAVQRLEEYIAIDPNGLHPRTELAKIYQRQGKLAEAVQRLEEYIALEPNGLHPRTELAKIYQRQGKLDEAVAIAEEGLALDPTNNFAISELLGAWTRKGEKEKCAERFFAFIEQPNYKFSRYSQAPVFRFFQCCRRFGMKNEAKLVYERFQSQLDDRNLHFYQSTFLD